MIEPGSLPDFNAPIRAHARKDFPLLQADMTIAEALAQIRREGIGERVIYFFAVDAEQRLVGVLPTRRLLTAPLDSPLADVMVRRVLAIPATATVLDACEFFVLYKLLAFPVIDENRRVVGVVDVSLFAEEMLEASEREDRQRPAPAVSSDIFESLGFRLEQIKGASTWQVFRYRFPWLLATVAGGTACAILAGFFEATLAHTVVIAMFLTMVLGLNESVSTQSMSVTIQTLRSAPVTWRWFITAFRRELPIAMLIGLSCGLLVAATVWIWRRDPRSAGVIGASIALSLVTASLFGLGVPSLLHWLKLDPKIAAGPIALALADFVALLIYFTSAWLVLT